MNEMNDLQILTNALDAATKGGAFNLAEAGRILQSINNIGRTLDRLIKLEQSLNNAKNQEKMPQDVEPAMEVVGEKGVETPKPRTRVKK